MHQSLVSPQLLVFQQDLSLLAGVAFLVVGINPIKALYYSQVLAGLLAPFLLLLLLILSNRKKVMGDYRNGWFDNIFGTLALIVMVAVGVLMFFG
jgi:Mn2+/Fe2+ NRAMP family transporter